MSRRLQKRHMGWFYLIAVFAIVLVAGCASVQPDMNGVNLTHKLEIKQTLLDPPRRFVRLEPTPLAEFTLINEYGSLATAYTACFRNYTALINTLEKSDLVKKVP